MHFETIPRPSHRIAVIGAGISGMGAAHMLASDYQVTLFEAEPRLGGHARTIIAGKNGDQPVDTGFLVFNYANYPLMADLFAELSVPVVKSNMSFGASIAHLIPFLAVFTTISIVGLLLPIRRFFSK